MSTPQFVSCAVASAAAAVAVVAAGRLPFIWQKQQLNVFAMAIIIIIIIMVVARAIAGITGIAGIASQPSFWRTIYFVFGSATAATALEIIAV